MELDLLKRMTDAHEKVVYAPRAQHSEEGRLVRLNGAGDAFVLFDHQPADASPMLCRAGDLFSVENATRLGLMPAPCCPHDRVAEHGEDGCTVGWTKGEDGTNRWMTGSGPGCPCPNRYRP